MIDYDKIDEAFNAQKDLVRRSLEHTGNYQDSFEQYVQNMGVDYVGLLRWAIEYAVTNADAGDTEEVIVGAFTRAFTLGILLGRKERP